MADDNDDNLATVSRGDLLSIVREMIQNQAQQSKELRDEIRSSVAPRKREFLFTTKIHKQEDFPTWQGNFLFELRRHNLDRYVLQSVPQPQDADEARLWREERSDVDSYIRSLIGDTKTFDALRGMGWNQDEINPKATYDMLTEAFEDSTDDSFAVLMEEFSTIRREKFASMEALRIRLNYLRNRLDSTNSPFRLAAQKGYLLMALRSIANIHQDLYLRSMTALKNNELTWASLMKELQQIIVTEKGNTKLAQLKIDTDKKKDNGNNKSAGNNNNSTERKDTSGERVTCKVCDWSITAGWIHCATCGHHHPPNVPICWWCFPEKAPDTWENKSLALQKKQERQQSSTTGPLHQQSGVQNPSTQPPPAPSKSAIKRVLFQTSLANLPLSDDMGFPNGPRHL